MAEWHINNHSDILEGIRFVARFNLPQDAEQIVREHNAFEALVVACEETKRGLEHWDSNSRACKSAEYALALARGESHD